MAGLPTLLERPAHGLISRSYQEHLECSRESPQRSEMSPQGFARAAFLQPWGGENRDCDPVDRTQAERFGMKFAVDRSSASRAVVQGSAVEPLLEGVSDHTRHVAPDLTGLGTPRLDHPEVVHALDRPCEAQSVPAKRQRAHSSEAGLARRASAHVASRGSSEGRRTRAARVAAAVDTIVRDTTGATEVCPRTQPPSVMRRAKTEPLDFPRGPSPPHPGPGTASGAARKGGPRQRGEPARESFPRGDLTGICNNGDLS
jgi:hypothetical protein